MVDCRPAAAAAPHDLAHQAPNGAPPDAHLNQQAPGNNEMGGHGITSPAAVRASTPATSNALTTYTGAMTPGGGYAGGGGGGGGGGGAPYACVKPVVWCAGASPPPAPPAGVNPHVYKSVQANGADLPMNDIPTLRYYFNLGVECMWAAYGPPPPHAPPRHYSPRDLAQDMQQMAIHERPLNHNSGGEQNHKHKPPGDKPQLGQGKGGAQRPLLGPRFKRGGNNQDNNQNQNNHNQNKGHNNNMGNKGPNNRRNSHTEARAPPHAGYGEGECVMEQPLLTLPYIPYPPPLYPIPYYPVESDPGMMGMMGGMGYVGYEEGVEYGAPLQYYPPAPHYPPPAHAHAHAHAAHAHAPHPAHPGHPAHAAHPAHAPHHAPHAHHAHHPHHPDHK